MNRVLTFLTAFLLTAVVVAGCKPDEPIPADDPDDPVVLDGCIDLGLPSGILWATCNIGASAPEEVGDYFAWGDTIPKEMYDWKNYRYATYVDSYLLTKYCTNPDCGVDGFSDGLATLEPVDDAARANLGPQWRMPTYEDWDELIQNTECVWTSMNGVDGRLFTAENGNSVFFPATGFRLDGDLICTNLGVYWSSSLQTNCQVAAWSLHFDYGNMHVCGTYERSRGHCVRAVCNNPLFGESNSMKNN